MQDAADPNILTNILVPSHRAVLLNFDERYEKLEEEKEKEEPHLVEAKYHSFTELRTSKSVLPNCSKISVLLFKPKVYLVINSKRMAAKKYQCALGIFGSRSVP